MNYFLNVAIKDYIYETGKIYNFQISNNKITFLDDLKTPQEISIAQTYELKILEHLDNHSKADFYDYLLPELEKIGFTKTDWNPRLYPTMGDV